MVPNASHRALPCPSQTVPQLEGARNRFDTGEGGIRAGEPPLTHTERFLLEVLGQMRAAGDAVDIALQHVPTHLVIEGITKLIWDLRKRQGEGDQLRLPSPPGCTGRALITAAFGPDRSPPERQEMHVHV